MELLPAGRDTRKRQGNLDRFLGLIETMCLNSMASQKKRAYHIKSRVIILGADV